MIKHTHTRLTALFPGIPRWAGTRKVKPVSGSGISWTICKSAPCSRQTTNQHPHHSSVLQITRQITMPAPHHSVFTGRICPDALSAAQPTASKHWRQNKWSKLNEKPRRSCGHLDRLSYFCGTHVRDQHTYRHTDRPRYTVCSNRPHPRG